MRADDLARAAVQPVGGSCAAGLPGEDWRERIDAATLADVKLVAPLFYLASGVVAVAVLAWAAVDQLFGTQDFRFLNALFLWLGVGLPLVGAGFIAGTVARRRTSLRPPPHYPDWQRDRADRP